MTPSCLRCLLHPAAQPLGNPYEARRAVSLLFQELYDEVADLLESFHHHEMPRTFYYFQPPGANPLCGAPAADPLRARVPRAPVPSPRKALISSWASAFVAWSRSKWRTAS